MRAEWTARGVLNVLLMMGTWLPETCREVETNIPRSSVHPVGFI